jgi:hypothetical protein
MDRVYGPVDHGTRSVHMDSRQCGAMGSPKLRRLVAPVDGSSLRRREKGEGSNAVLTKGFNDLGKGGVELAATILARRRSEGEMERWNLSWGWTRRQRRALGHLL